ncbi:capsid assembly protein [Elioraea sp.]|uniref:capsid assembly protein n=1 Tax=Elioraea sp. TaxID=2185103 RepID=UPI003F71281E
MADNLIDITIEDADGKSGAAKPAMRGKRPPEVPEKFWDEDAGQIRVDALLKSYLELERRLSRMVPLPEDEADDEARNRLLRALGVPESPDAYTIEPHHPLLTPDPDVNRRLHQAGFTPKQVQLVYDLAGERLLPLIAEAAQMFEAERQIERLKDHFGGEERWARVAKQLAAWGKSKLPDAVFDALSSTHEGVLALHRMMEKNEPGLMRDAEPGPSLGEDELRAMMRDPRYWRKRDPDFVSRVSDGFRRLFPGER